MSGVDELREFLVLVSVSGSDSGSFGHEAPVAGMQGCFLEDREEEATYNSQFNANVI